MVRTKTLVVDEEENNEQQWEVTKRVFSRSEEYKQQIHSALCNAHYETVIVTNVTGYTGSLDIKRMACRWAPSLPCIGTHGKAHWIFEPN